MNNSVEHDLKEHEKHKDYKKDCPYCETEKMRELDLEPSEEDVPDEAKQIKTKN
jgi:hypothetical protein